MCAVEKNEFEMRMCLYERVIGENVSEHKRSRWKKAMMDQRRENRNAFFPPWIFPGLLEDPSYPEK